MKAILLLVASAVVYIAPAQQFIDKTAAAGLDGLQDANISLAVADYDNDGWDDIYVGRIGSANALLRNNGDGTFTNRAAIAGVAGNALTYTAVWGDLDNDGDQDLYVGNRDMPKTYYRNNGDGTFTDATLVSGLGNAGRARSLLLADVDSDGWLDVYVANLGQENSLYRNNGDGTFTDVTAEVGLSDPLLSMGAVFFDYDNDGDQDLYLTHDNNQPNILYENDGTGHFTDVSLASGAQIAAFGMGVDIGDVNNDGWLDLYITNLYENNLLLNQANGQFVDIAATAGVDDYGMGWGTAILTQITTDGRIFMLSMIAISPLTNVLYRNLGIILSKSPVLTSRKVQPLAGMLL
ncbi:MAG: VCBS repeat-containing protein [Saprospiraceae bacterium]